MIEEFRREVPTTHQNISELSIQNWKNKTIWTGDNLPIMRGMNSNSVDLIYLDPPFNSNTNYAAPIGSEAAGAEFKDTWTLNDLDIEWLDLIESKYPALNHIIRATASDSKKSYLIYMAVRLIEMQRILKSSGSIYLHCDSTMSHYLKVVMDIIFGGSKFQSEITWQRTSSHNDRVFGNVSDTILFYGQSCEIKDELMIPHDPAYIKKNFTHKDERGRYRLGDLTGPGTSTGESGQPWMGVDPTKSNRCWSVPKSGRIATWIEENHIPNYRKIESLHDRLDALNQAEFIHFPKKKNGIPTLKRYLAATEEGKLPTDIWTDIPNLSSRSKEAEGYPTQKPINLLKRIITASTEEGDVVFDPFCGCATTLVSAETMPHPRKWVGIDISPKASELVVSRVNKVQGLFANIIHRADIPIRTDLGIIPKYNSKENKNTLYGNQSGFCNACKTHFQKQNLVIDHIIAKNKGGTDHIENLQLLCGHCNSVKGDRGMEYLLANLKKGN